MKNLIETHAHIYSDQFKDDRDEMIARAKKAGVQKIFMPNVDLDSIEGMLALEKQYPDFCFPMMGLHPCSVKEDVDLVLDKLYSWYQKRTFCAVGEIGLDYYWDLTFKEEQKKAFRTQIEWALEFDIPIVIHSRESNEDVLAILREFSGRDLKGIFHCFSGNVEQAKEAISLGMLIGIGGVVTYKKSEELAQVVKEIDLEKLVLETDSPYLAPVPYRGKRNEPAYISEVALKICEIKRITLQEVENVTSVNALSLFKVYEKI